MTLNTDIHANRMHVALSSPHRLFSLAGSRYRNGTDYEYIKDVHRIATYCDCTVWTVKVNMGMSMHPEPGLLIREVDCNEWYHGTVEPD